MRLRQLILSLKFIAMTLTCSSCYTPLADGQGFIFCTGCGTPHFFGEMTSPFEVMGVARSFILDEKALEDKYYELSKRLHPDRFASGSNTARFKSQELAATLNQAYFALRQREPRLEALLKSSGLLKDSERSVGQAQIPADLAEEYFEIQEMSSESPDNAISLIKNFQKKLEGKRKELTEQMYQIAERADWKSSLELEKIVELRRQRSYVRSMLENLEKLGAGRE